MQNAMKPLSKLAGLPTSYRVCVYRTDGEIFDSDNSRLVDIMEMTFPAALKRETSFEICEKIIEEETLETALGQSFALGTLADREALTRSGFPQCAECGIIMVKMRGSQVHVCPNCGWFPGKDELIS